MKKATDLMWEIAKRARDLANMRMPVLRRAASYEGMDLGDSSRGAIIEAVLVEEFEDRFKEIADLQADAERATRDGDWT